MARVQKLSHIWIGAEYLKHLTVCEKAENKFPNMGQNHAKENFYVSMSLKAGPTIELLGANNAVILLKHCVTRFLTPVQRCTLQEQLRLSRAVAPKLIALLQSLLDMVHLHW